MTESKMKTNNLSGNRAGSTMYNISDYGAISGGSVLNTQAIQSAIDECCLNGGGTVVVPAGVFLTGTIELKKNVLLHLSPGAVLRASGNRADYRKVFPERNSLIERPNFCFNLDEHLIFAKDTENTGITGCGTIDAQGTLFYDTEKLRKLSSKYKPGNVEYTLKEWRPGAIISFQKCTNCILQDFSVKNNPTTVLWLFHCDGVSVRDIKMKSDPLVQEGDGIHVQSSKNVIISGCNIDTEDDALAIFCHMYDVYTDDQVPDCLDSENITVSNCIFSSACCGIRCGSRGSHAIRNINISNVIIKKASVAIDFICTGGLTRNFIRLGNTDYTGVHTENIHFSNIIASDVRYGIRMNILSDTSMDAGINNISFSGIRINSKYGNYISGNPERPVENITFRDCQFTINDDIRKIAEDVPAAELFIWGKVYPYPFIIRDALDIKFFNSRITFAADAKGWNKNILCERSNDIDLKELKIITAGKIC